jgi:hypothetical protein
MKDKIFVFTSSFSSVKPFYFKILHICILTYGLEAFKLLNDEKHRKSGDDVSIAFKEYQDEMISKFPNKSSSVEVVRTLMK